MKKQKSIKVIKANDVALADPLPADGNLEAEPASDRELTNNVKDWITERRETSLTEQRSSISQLKKWERQNRQLRKKSNKS